MNELDGEIDRPQRGKQPPDLAGQLPRGRAEQRGRITLAPRPVYPPQAGPRRLHGRSPGRLG
jgi:hypothetical protein